MSDESGEPVDDTPPSVAEAPPLPPHPGEVIRARLAELNADPAIPTITQKRLAVDLGVSEKHMSAVMTGRDGISPRFAVRVEQVLGVSADQLMVMQGRYDAAQQRARMAGEAVSVPGGIMARLAPYHQLIMVLSDLPVLVREARRRRGLSMRDVEDKYGVALNVLSRFERRTGTIYVDTALTLLRFVADEPPTPGTAPVAPGEPEEGAPAPESGGP